LDLICPQPWGAWYLTAIFDHAKYIKDFTKAGIDVFASAETFNAVSVTGHRAIKIGSEGQFTVGPFAVRSFPVEHDCHGAVGFLISAGNDRIVFITDSSYCKYRFNGITHLMIEANFDDDILERNMSAGLVERSRYQRLKKSHMSLQRVKDFLKEQDTSCLTEIHLMHLSDNNSDEQLFKAEIQKITGVPVYICKR